MTTMLADPNDPQKKLQQPGRMIAQQANPFQQQPGQDNNVEQQALSSALAGPMPNDHPNMAAPPRTAGSPPVVPPGGATGGMANGRPTPAPAPMPAALATPQVNTRLMEGDQRKLADANHAKKSPKYDFLQLAQQGKYGYDQLGDMLKELQAGPNAQHWQGWTADRDKLKFTGDPSQLGEQWKGVTTVDAIGGFNSGNPQGFRWGADDGGTGGQPQPAQMALRQALMQPTAGSPMVRPGGPGPVLFDAATGTAGHGGPQGNAGANPNDPFTAMGGGVRLPNGSWVPKNHPLANTPGASGQAQVPQSGNFAGDWQAGFRPPDEGIYKPGTFPTTDLETYTGKQFDKSGLPTYEGYQFGKAPIDKYVANLLEKQNFDTYTPDQISQFSGPDQSGVENQQTALLQRLLGSTSMTDQGVSQLKERQKEEALAMQKQLQDQAGQRAASRGVMGGNLDATNRRIGDATLQSVLSGNRDIDLMKMQQDRADQMGATGLASDVLNAQMGLKVQGFNAGLAGQQAQAGLNIAGVQSKNDASRFNLNQFLSGEGLRQAQAASGQNAFGLGLQRDQAQANEGRFAYGSKADARRFGADLEARQADEDFRAFGTRNDKTRFALDRALQGENLKRAGADSLLSAWNQSNAFGLQNKGLGIQEMLGRGNLDMEGRRLGEQGRQFDLSHTLANRQLGQNADQFNTQMGFNYSNLTANQQNQLMALMASLYGGR